MAKIKAKRLLGSVLLAALLLPLPAAAMQPQLEHRYTFEAVYVQETPSPAQSPELPESPAPVFTMEPLPGGEMPLLMPDSPVLEELFARNEPEADTSARTAPVMTTAATGGDHVPYLSGTGGLFEPDRAVTRAEFAGLLASVVTDLPDRPTVLHDAPWSGEEAVAIQKAVGLGLMEAPNGFFRPNDPITRAECACALASLLPYDMHGDTQEADEAGETLSFPDVSAGDPACEAITRAADCGLLAAADEEGHFAPEEALKRWELAAAFNRVLGRTPDQTFLSQMPAFETFSDVPADHPGFWDILEATVHHISVAGDAAAERWVWADVKMLEDGFRRIGGRLYCVENGAFVRDQYRGYLYFDSYGRYTTGSAELDTRLNNIIERLTNDTMTRDQKLRVLFNYCRDYYTYLKRPLISKGQTGWEPEYALFFLRNGKGNCYCFSAAYCLLCRNLGLPAYTVVGSALNSPHGWVEIQLDGATYLFDTQLEWRYLHDWGMKGYNFFKQPYYSTTVAYSR